MIASVRFSIEECRYKESKGMVLNRQPTLQYRLFCNQGPQELCVRMKAASLNEAIAYHRMLQTQDALCQFIPQFYGVVDQAGDQINLDQELTSCSLEDLHLKYPNVYILLKDL